MKLLLNLTSKCDFWQLSDTDLSYLKEQLPMFDIVNMQNPADLEDADFYFGWTFDEAWIPLAKRLRLVVVPSAGRDYLPVKQLEKARIPVVTGTGFHAIPMTEQILAYILGFSRGIFQTAQCKKNERWWKDSVREHFFDINGKTLAIFGCGSVGKRLAKVCMALGMRVIGIRRNILQLEEYIEWHTPDYTDQALARADIVVNLLPLTEETENFFNAARFAAMGKCKLFINIGRGKTVVDDALREALDSGIITYCALDVYSEKPPKMDSFLRKNDSVLLTPKTGVFFQNYMYYAVRFLVVVVRKCMEILGSMNLKYAKNEYVFMVLKKYFNNDRLANLIDYSSDDLLNHESFLNKCNMEKNEILQAYKASNRKWPFLAFTINSLCNRQCIFCDAKNEVSDVISIEEYREIARVSNSWGVTKAHLSGGEPTIRKDVVEIIRVLSEELKSKNKQIGITTNGSCSFELIDQMIDAGLTNINFSIHSMNEHNYRKIMGTGSPKDVIPKVIFCIEKGLAVKVNCTLLRSYVDDALQMLDLPQKYPLDLRFIELQEIGPVVKFFDKEFISEDEFFALPHVRTILEQSTGEKDRDTIGVRSPGKYVQIKDYPGSFAVISNTSMPVCADGNRLKITPTGRLRPCTLENCDINLREHLNKDLDDVFRKVFFTMLTRESNPCHRGFHYIDYNLRWDNYHF